MKNMCYCSQSNIVPIVQGADGMWKKESAAIGKRNAKKMNIVPIKSKNVPQIQPQQTDGMRGANIYTVSPLGTYACNCKEQPRLE